MSHIVIGPLEKHKLAPLAVFAGDLTIAFQNRQLEESDPVSCSMMYDTRVLEQEWGAGLPGWMYIHDYQPFVAFAFAECSLEQVVEHLKAAGHDVTLYGVDPEVIVVIII